MDVDIKIWSLNTLIGLYNRGRLNLNPDYQRNDIWSAKAKKALIDSILKNYPVPNIILHKVKDDSYELVDGQQRMRTILGYKKGIITNPSGEKINKETAKQLSAFKLPIIIVSNLDRDEKIEEIYDLINSTGLRLNRPELKKAKHFDTRFLKLIEELSQEPEYTNLRLFTDSSMNRMADVDFTGELIALLKYGITDKKNYVDKLFESDITEEEYEKYLSKFKSILQQFSRLNKVYPIHNTRYKQRNDYYTFFGFIKDNLSLRPESLDYFYKIMVVIGPDITPSNEQCLTLQDYAFNCVSQSNSKDARQGRQGFLSNILLNSDSKPNEDQKDILEFYGIENTNLQKVESFYTFNLASLNSSLESPFVFD
jgi:Asp-tRNA(Asn)/Glu-tRNA(Gln) amidotransferase C subunit